MLERFKRSETSERFKVEDVKRPSSQSFKRPTIGYGMKVYFNSANSSLQLVEEIHNDSFRLCYGALRSTPTKCLQHRCNEMPVKIFEQLCLCCRAHVYTFTSDSNHPTQVVIKDNWQERFSNNPNFTFLNIATKFCLKILRFR